MNKFLEALGIWKIVSTIGWMVVGDSLLRPFIKKHITPRVDLVVAEITDWRRVNHYLQGHDTKRSYNCADCKFPRPNNVDSIS